MSNTHDMTYSPRPVNRRAEWTVGVLLALSLVGFALSFLTPYSGVVQLCCLFAIVYALFVTHIYNLV